METLAATDRWPFRADEETLIQREHLCLNELLGETVKLRIAHYKTMKVTKCEARRRPEYQIERGLSEWKLWFPRTEAHSVAYVRRLDVKVDGKWETVWDDGLMDLNPWDRENPSTSAKPTGRKYKGATI